MPIVVPGAAVNYPSPMLAVGLLFGLPPKEGQKSVPAEIDWGTMGGPQKVVNFNLNSAGATQALSQICALHVDNSACGTDIQFVFTDTQETYTVAAYQPYALFPVFTKSQQFFVIAGINGETVEAVDVTRFSMFNFVPPPVVLPLSEEQNSESINGIPADGATTATLVPFNITGTLEAISIERISPITATGTQTFQIQDADAKVLAAGSFDASTGQSHNDIILSLNPMRVRFRNGLRLLQGGTAVGGQYVVNLLYRAP